MRFIDITIRSNDVFLNYRYFIDLIENYVNIFVLNTINFDKV